MLSNDTWNEGNYKSGFLDVIIMAKWGFWLPGNRTQLSANWLQTSCSSVVFSFELWHLLFDHCQINLPYFAYHPPYIIFQPWSHNVQHTCCQGNINCSLTPTTLDATSHPQVTKNWYLHTLALMTSLPLPPLSIGTPLWFPGKILTSLISLAR